MRQRHYERKRERERRGKRERKKTHRQPDRDIEIEGQTARLRDRQTDAWDRQAGRDRNRDRQAVGDRTVRLVEY